MPDLSNPRPLDIIVGELDVADREGWTCEETAVDIINALDALGYEIKKRDPLSDPNLSWGTAEDVAAYFEASVDAPQDGER